MLMVYLSVLVLLKQSVDFTVKFISPALPRLYSYSKAEKRKREFQSKLEALLDEQKQISMMEEFAKYSKLQRKIDYLKNEITQISNKLSKKFLYIQTVISWVLHVFISVSLAYRIYMYRYEPVLQVPPKLVYPNFLAQLVAFPTGIPGDVGCIFWLFVCRLTFSTCGKHFIK